MKINNVDKIFVVHHSPLVDRKNRLEKIFKKLDLDVEWVEKYLPDEIDYDKEVGRPVIEKGTEFAIQQNKYTYHKNVGKKVTISELSLILKHKYCLLKQIENNYENIIIFEDDINLDINSIKYLNDNMDEFQDGVNKYELDILMLGTAFNFKPVNNTGVYIHYNKNQLTRCAHAIAFNIKSTQIILNGIFPMNLPWDFKLNELIILNNLNIAWSEPGLTQFSLGGNSTIKK